MMAGCIKHYWPDVSCVEFTEDEAYMQMFSSCCHLECPKHGRCDYTGPNNNCHISLSNLKVLQEDSLDCFEMQKKICSI